MTGQDRPDTSPESLGQPAQKRRRSRAGCYTCRRRKKACDNARPVCGSCTRLGIPCVFPKLYRNAKGELVPSPQPNGRTKKLSRESESPETALYSSNAATSSSNPWDATPAGHQTTWQSAHSHPSATSTNYPLEDADASGDNDNEFSDTALDAFLASLGDTAENGQGWVWPLFNDTGLELDLGVHGGATPGGSHGHGQGSSGTNNPPAPGSSHSQQQQQPTMYDHSPTSVTSVPPNPDFSHHNKMAVTTTNVLDHLPTLYDYWVNSFSHVLSVLGPGHNPQVNNMLPVVQRSPLVMCALIAWAATHRANIGHPYQDVARLATDTTEMQADNLDIERELTPDEREEYMLTLLILGGIEIVTGDLKGWVRRLPMTRRLLAKVVETIDFNTSLTWQALAYNCAYHDILASLTTTKAPEFPFELYDRILCAGELEMDSYMGATRQVFQFLVEIAAMAGKMTAIQSRPPGPDRDRATGAVLAEADALLVRLKAIDLPPGLFVHPLPIGTDRSLLIVSFYTYQLAAEMYLRQSVQRCGPSDLYTKQLGVRLLTNIRSILGTPNESQMCFPLFLAGVVTADEKGRAEVVRIFTQFSERVQVRNVFAVVNLLLEVWKRDPDGDRYVDWRRVAEEMDVAHSFA